MTSQRPVLIVDYDPLWPLLFTELAAAISQTVGTLALKIEHVGSTSVPGLVAKPIIDVDVVIRSRDDVPEAARRLATLGYVHEGDLGVTGREAFARADGLTPWDGSKRQWPEHHLYVCAQGSQELARHLTFRDYLRTHPDAATAYGELKQRLAEVFRNDREAYTEGKTAFVEAVLRATMG